MNIVDNNNLLSINKVFKTLLMAVAAATPLSLMAEGETKDRGFALEEVVVTARKREESVQEVPVAVSAFSAESMKSLGLSNVKDFEGVVPGLNMGGGGNGAKGDSNPYIRGVGQRETKVTVDGAVGTYLDGVYIGRAAGALLDAVDVESIQVLRGPQGTLFGKNTTGGAIVIKTARPGPDFGGHVDVTVGNYNRQNASAAVNVPITDSLFSRITVASVKRDGFTTNVLDGTDWSDDDRLMGVGQLRWEVTEDLLADLLISSTKTRQLSRGQKCKFLGDAIADATGLDLKPLLEGNYDAHSVVPAEDECNASGADLPNDKFASEHNNSADSIFGSSVYEVDTYTYALTLGWNAGEVGFLENLDVKSISALRTTEQMADEDLDGSGAGLTGRKAPVANKTDQYSQEFQFIGSSMDGKLNITLGLYAFLEETDGDWLQSYAAFNENITTPNAILLASSQLTERETENKATAAYAQFDYDVTERIEVTFGIRYTDETRETRYKEAGVYLPSIGVGEFCPNAQCSTYLDTILVHEFSEPGAAPFDQWQYGFDANNNGNLEQRELGTFGESKGERSDHAWTPSFSAKFLASDEMMETFSLDDGMAFITLSQGFRSGGVVVANGDFDGNGINDLAQFEPEEVENIEIGIKLDAFDRKLRANMAAYYTDYTDIQLTTIKLDGGIPLPGIDNAGRAVIQGVEGEFTILPSENIRITASFAYTDGDYKEYDIEAEVPGDPAATTVMTDRSDEPMPRLAEWTAFIAADYFVYTETLGTVIPSVSMRYSSEIYHGFDRTSFLVAEELTSDSVIFYDARLTWQLPDDRTTVTFWGKNLTNEDDYLVGGVPLPAVNRSAGQVFAEPRTYGLDVSYRFGE